jgi:hypothetical protein
MNWEESEAATVDQNGILYSNTALDLDPSRRIHHLYVG